MATSTTKTNISKPSTANMTVASSVKNTPAFTTTSNMSKPVVTTPTVTKTTTVTPNSSTIAKTVTGGSNPTGMTTSQVKAFQSANGLVADGIIGPLTQAKLNASGGSTTNTGTKEKVTPINPNTAKITTPTLSTPTNTVFPPSPTPDINESNAINTGLNVKAQNLTLQQQKEAEYAKQDKTALDKYNALMDNKPESQADMWQQAQNDLQITQKKNLVNNLTGQLNQITAQGEALKLSTIGQGRGIPEAILGGQQAQIARETAIQALPVSAQLSAAQGDLDSAKEDLNTLYKLRSADAQAQYEYQNKRIEAFYDYADKQSQRKLDDIKQQQTYEHEDLQNAIKNQNNMAQMAFDNNQASLGGQISKLDPKSATFKEDLARLTSKLVDPIKNLDIALKNAQIANQKAETAKIKAEASATNTISPYQAERQGRIIQSIDELTGQVNDKTVGAGALMSFIPGTDAKYFATQVDSLVANITFGELTAMREASKTGGALGQVSDREGALLGAALGAIADRTITPEQYKVQLQKIKDSITRWNNAAGSSALSPTDKYYLQSTGAVTSTNSNSRESSYINSL